MKSRPLLIALALGLGLTLVAVVYQTSIAAAPVGSNAPTTAYPPEGIADVAGATDAWWMAVQMQFDRIDDASAVSPLATDLLAAVPSWTATGEGWGDRFGFSVASAGDVNGDGYADAIVGGYGLRRGRARTARPRLRLPRLGRGSI